MDNKNYNEKIFNEDIDKISNEINEIESLYSEIKDHYDTVRNSYARGSLTFIERQTGNLVNLRMAKLNLIKERINIKKICTEFKFKDLQIQEKLKDDVEDIDVDSILLQLSEKINTISNNKEDNNSRKKELDEEDIDSILDERINDDKINKEIDSILSFETKDEDNNIDEDSTQIGVDKNNVFYEINSNNEIIHTLGNIENIIKIDNDYAYGESGNKYLYIEFE